MSQFYILSLKHTNRRHEHITVWQRFHCGYTPVLGDYAGRYCFGEAVSLNDGYDCIAVPVEAVDAVSLPEPMYKRRDGLFRLYDQRGPVLENTRGTWAKLITASLVDGRFAKPKPETFRGKAISVYELGAA
jgi:hypothetical protein